jgi:putative colanic acid biosynthesis UDP-glucose lipid carrier transferase
LLKLAEDYFFASLLLVLLSPLMLLIAIAIKVDSPGPVLYRQLRGGFNRRIFEMRKFRTMYYSSEPLAGRTEQAVPGDRRITRVGRWLRRTSLDELPQLFNVFRGEMSIVGPRPHAVDHDDAFGALVPHYVSRLRVKPGITGWAQVNGFRGVTDTTDKIKARVEHDLHYIDHWSLWLDIKIIAMTPLVGLIHRNAY